MINLLKNSIPTYYAQIVRNKYMKIERNNKTEHLYNVSFDCNLNFSSYLLSYKRSFDILIKEIIDTGYLVDYTVFPILFIARHCMELGLKTNIRYFSKYSKKNDYTKNGTHDLANLFRAFKLHVYETFKMLKSEYSIIVTDEDKQLFDELYSEVEKLNNIFHTMDKKSDAFRYPIDKKQNPSFRKGESINIFDVNNLLEKSMNLFLHTADVFSKYTDFAEEIEKEYESLQREQYEEITPY